MPNCRTTNCRNAATVRTNFALQQCGAAKCRTAYVSIYGKIKCGRDLKIVSLKKNSRRVGTDRTGLAIGLKGLKLRAPNFWGPPKWYIVITF